MKTHSSHAEKGNSTSRVDRKRYWANGLKLLAAQCSDTAREKEGATGYTAVFILKSGSKI